MIDTHTHLYPSCYGDDAGAAVERSLAAGVSHLILPNVDAESIPSIREMHEKYPDITSIAMGLHPSDVAADWQKVLDLMDKELERGDFIAIGEIGIDLHWEKENLPIQKEAFRRQLHKADQLQLPVIIHSREAFPETLEVIREVKPTVPLIFHSFTGTPEDVETIREVCDPYFGINGVVTYKNAPYLRDALSVIGIYKIVLETDAPFLTPAPHRGKKNDSSYLGFIRDKVAEVLSMPPDEVEKITDSNARRLFNL